MCFYVLAFCNAMHFCVLESGSAQGFSKSYPKMSHKRTFQGFLENYHNKKVVKHVDGADGAPLQGFSCNKEFGLP